VTESGISCLDDRIIHMQRRSVHLNPAGLILGEQKVCSICNAIPTVCRSLTMNQSISIFGSAAEGRSRREIFASGTAPSHSGDVLCKLRSYI
jgi:hypothetical protein